MRKFIWKRALSLALSLAMLLTLVPAFDVLPEAEAAQSRIADTGKEYITLPITIRDFAADGMLFEYNELNKKTEAGSTSTYTCLYNPSSWSTNSYKGIRVCPYGNNVWKDASLLWHCVICNSKGKVVKVIPSGAAKSDAYGAAMKSGYYAVWAWDGDATAYGILSAITEANKSTYKITYSGTKLSITTGGTGGSFNKADTKAFGLLETNTNDYYNVLGSDTLGQMSNTIYGSVLFNNGSWGLKTDPDPKRAKLYSAFDRTTPYATQTVYGAYIRTNLVDKDLDADGKPVYTAETVTFLAEFMQKIMAVDWQNADGTYNSYHVEGVKLFDETGNYVGPNVPDAVYDLADILRMSVKAAGSRLGTYAEAKSKFQSGMLQYPGQVETWFDAAYYLLHYTWRDSYMDNLIGRAGIDGYGMPIDRYNSMHLVKTTNEEGETCYVFNSKYDDTVYNIQNGEIWNQQIKTGAIRKGSDNTEQYVRGNPLPVNCFDPLGPSGSGQNLGYGMSDDTYGNMTGDYADWSEYYDTTNYNLTLEGNAQFIYHKGKGQYFTFTGDDDVYLFINGVRVMDLGGAHSISKARVDLDEVAEACGMVDSGNYHFDFFFMERHGNASNFGIETNIELAQLSNNTTKTGYQNGVSTGYNGPVDPSKHVGYSFEMKNDGTGSIYNLTFDDPAIGVYFGYNRTQLYPSDFTDEQKKLYNLSDLYVIKYASDGTISRYLRPGEITSEKMLEDILAAGLNPGEKIGIYGFKYFIPEDEWIPIYGYDAEGNRFISDYYFPNEVSTTATNHPEEVVPSLRGLDDWRVTQMDLVFEPFHVYDWVNKDVSRNPATVCNWRTPTQAGLPFSGGVTVPKNKLTEYLREHDTIDITVPADAKIVLCNSEGKENEEVLNPNVTLNADGSITYQSTKTGSDTVFYKVKWNGNTYNDVVFNYDVYTYGTVNNIFVLDYGLKVELNTHQFGFYTNDTTAIDQNRRDMLTEVVGLVNTSGTAITQKTGTYGDFTCDGTTLNNDNNISVEYEPKKIMNHVDTVLARVRLMEEDATEFSIYTGVDMAQTVKVAPASVVYYEENFPGITYVNKGENNWVHYETEDQNGESVAGDYQSPDQDSNYGSDPNYGEDKEGWIPDDGTDTGTGSGTGTGDNTNNAINPDGDPDETEKYLLDTAKLSSLQKSALKAMEKFLGVHGTDSNGSIYELTVNTTGDVMSFEFTGTGFEILSRTTDEQYAIIAVQVQRHKKDATGNPVYEADGKTPVYEVVRHKPVITESIGGDMYQVPIISMTGLDHGAYRVVVTAAGSTANATRVLYIDGIRIYGPLAKDEALEYYNPNEVNAEFIEIKHLVKQGKAAYFGVEKNGYLVSGISYAEDIGDDGLMREIDNADEYMLNGPNNELYLSATGRQGNMVAFYLVPNENVPESARTIQIGAHRKVDPAEDAYGYVRMTYGSTREDIVEDGNYVDISSGTEMYYTVDPEKLFEDENGYLLMIGTNCGENDDFETLSLTNLKISGYTVVAIEPIVKQAYESGNPEDSTFIAELIAIFEAMMAAPEDENGEEDVPGETTAPPIDSGDFIFSDGAPDDIPDATEPEETDPEETVNDIAE